MEGFSGFSAKGPKQADLRAVASLSRGQAMQEFLHGRGDGPARSRLSGSFLQALARSRLLSESQCQEAGRKAALLELGDIGLAKHLGDSGVITPWQALRLLSGKTSFFLGPYCLLEQIGSGGAAVIYKARHEGRGNIVAIKVISATASADRVARARFQREARAAAAIRHPNVVAAYGGHSVRGARFLVLEYIEGDDLGRWLKRHPSLPLAWACEAAAQVAQGLECLHQRGLVHRDVKPNNLLVVARSFAEIPVVKIADLGAACLTRACHNDDEPPLTATDQFLGTPNFVAPEQVLNAHAVDHRADIFSLGCTLFKLLTQATPWDGATIAEKLLIRTQQDAPPASRFRRETPAKLDRVVARMLARDPGQRFESAREVVDALAPFRMQRAPIAGPGGGPRIPREGSPSCEREANVSEDLKRADATVEHAESPHWQLQRLTARGGKTSYPLAENQCLVIGRAADCDIQVRDLRASRRHCALTYCDSKWFVQDLGSNNGTIVNGVAVEQAELRHGDLLRFGAVELTMVAPQRPTCLPAAETTHSAKVADVTMLQPKLWEPRRLLEKLAAAARKGAGEG